MPNFMYATAASCSPDKAFFFSRCIRKSNQRIKCDHQHINILDNHPRSQDIVQSAVHPTQYLKQLLGAVLLKLCFMHHW